jgi:hypothetical protein
VSTLKVWRYDAMNTENEWSFNGATLGWKGGINNFVYIPVAELTNNGVLEGIQFAFAGGGNQMIGCITYVAELPAA